MLTAVALVVRQFRTTDWPRSIAEGSAVMLAVGVGPADAGGRALVGTGAVFLWQPAAVSRTRLRGRMALEIRDDVRDVRRFIVFLFGPS